MFKFFKRKKNKRLAGIQIIDNFETHPIPFRTYYGGCRPVQYVETAKMRNLYENALKDVENVIYQGLIDEYSNPQVFDEIIAAYYKQIENEIERQYISFSDVIQSIRNVAKEELHRGRREEEILNAAVKAADENKKGKGGLYVEMEK